MKQYAYAVMAGSLVLWASACSTSPQTAPEPQTDAEEETAGSESNSLPGALNQLAKGLQDAAKAAEEMQNVTIEPIDFRELRDLLPEDAAGLERTDVTGEKSGATGFSVSIAEADYSDGNGRDMNITITDAGSMTSLVTFGMAWIDMNIDRESDTGFERTDEFEGHKSFQKYDGASDPATGEIIVLVANRFVVKVEGTGVSFDDLRKAARSVDLAELDNRKDEGVTKSAES